MGRSRESNRYIFRAIVKVGDLVRKVDGYGAGLLMGLVVQVQEAIVLVLTDDDIDKWQKNFTEVINEMD